MEGGGRPVLSFEQSFILFSSFPLLLAFVVGGLGWRHALRSEWPFIIIIISIIIIIIIRRSRINPMPPTVKDRD